MNNPEKKGILLFVKYPKIDQVKNRLSASIDKKEVVKIYSFFVEDILQKLKKTPYEIIICYYPKNAIYKFKKWLNSDYFYIPQKGRNLGERLKNGFLQGFQNGFSKLIAIGSDSPDLTMDYINTAFENLDVYDTIIGPCIDGGYYLIGFSKNSYYPKVFHNIPWSTNKVYKVSFKVLKKANLKVYILPLWEDVDTIDDLLYLYKKNQNTDFKSSKTITYLSDLFKNKEKTKFGDKKIEKK